MKSRVPVALVLLLSLSLGGCATRHLDEQNAVAMGNARPATSGPAAAPTQGRVVDLGGDVVSVVSLGGETIGVQLAAPPRMVLGLVSGDRWTELAEAELPAGAGVAEPGDDVALVPYGDGVVVIHADGKADRRSGLGATTGVAQLATGQLLTGTPGGEVVVREPGGAETKRVPGLHAADQLVADGQHVAVLSRSDTTVGTVDRDAGQTSSILRAGKGAGRAAASPDGTMVVSDTVGDALLVYSMAPVRLHQLFPVGPAPWAVATDSRSSLVWVTTTGDNRVLAYDLGSGLGARVADIGTVRQPDSLAVTAGGSVAVGSRSGGGLHLLAPVPGR